MKDLGKANQRCGFSLLELLVTVSLVALIIGISIPSYQKWTARAKKATCISKMRTIHSAFSSALIEKGEWPQIPTDDEGNLPKWDQSEYFAFWLRTMEPYGLGPDSWVCPADEDAVASLKTKGKKDDADYIGSYIPTWFSPGSSTPFRWNQPWLMERAGFHGKGHHLMMPDGSITETANPFSGR